MSLSVQLQDVGKKYNREWVFKNVSVEFNSGEKIAILGSNGSGKSTLLQLLSGYVSPTTGTFSLFENGIRIPSEKVYSRVAIASPYLELIEDFTLWELFDHHAVFKPFVSEFSVEKFIEETRLNVNKNKFIKHFSSGMKQRVKLALALYSDVPLLLLDEPVSNLDQHGIEWYRKLILSQNKNRIIVVASNKLSEEYDFCNTLMNIEDFKKQNKF
jgi:ABC-type multidrug transport system ATPase subunit